ncbi:ABC transporter permease [Chloroflexota bacterium]
MSAALTLWHKHMRKLRGHPEEIFGMLIQPVLWIVLFGVGMKGLLGPSMPGGGASYIDFMVPGIIALTALGGAIGGGTVWLDERLRGIVKEYLVAPIPRLSILLGNALSIVTKTLIQSIVILIVGVLMGAALGLNPLGWLGGLVLIAGYGLGFAGIALAVASKTNSPGSYHMLIFMLNLPLLFLSNALYPLTALPTWMQVCARINPTSYIVDGIRQMVFSDYKQMGGTESFQLWLCFVVIFTFAACGMLLAYTLFKKAIK